tara:strand:+ start:925 stop:1905 length:981 start_codon:yes stop_codon:yes gene_type:complete
MGRFSPYQLAAPQANLQDLIEKSRASGTQTRLATGRQKGSMREELQKQLEEANKRAQQKSKKHGGLWKGIKTIGSLFGPMGAAIAGGIAGLGQGQQQRKGRKELLDVGTADRFSKTFLRKDLKSYKDEAESMQMSSGDVLQSGAAGALESWIGSTMMGGEKGEGLGKRIFGKKESFVPGTAPGSSVGFNPKTDLLASQTSTPMWQDTITGTGSGGSFDIGISGARTQASQNMFGLEDLTSTGKGQLAFSSGKASGMRGMGSGAMGGMKADLIANPIGSMGTSRATPFKSLFEELQGFGKKKIDYNELSEGTNKASLIQYFLNQMGG